MIRLVLETVLHTVIFPGAVMVAVPFVLLSHCPELYAFSSPSGRVVGGLLILGSMVLGSWCTHHFIAVGQGTPNPLDPPVFLVRAGPYQIVRNPMYLSVVAALAGEAVAFGSVTLLAYLMLVVVVIHFVVVFYEEPTIRRSFGAAYEDYCKRVPRWLPRVVVRQPRGASPSSRSDEW